MLGVPAPVRPVHFSFVLTAPLIALGIYMPFLGATMLAVLAVERFVCAAPSPTAETYQEGVEDLVHQMRDQNLIGAF